jgi:putative transposase
MEPLRPGAHYHIYNRGNNRENLFVQEKNYRYFLALYGKYIEPVAETFAYCLLPNHFHLLVRIRDSETTSPSKAFSNLFNAYARAFNRAYGRTGALFQRPFQRIEVTTNEYLRQLVVYIHRNPEHHKLIANFRDWPFSSYPALITTSSTKVQRGTVCEWFEGVESLISAHESDATMQSATLGPEELD